MQPQTPRRRLVMLVASLAVLAAVVVAAVVMVGQARRSRVSLPDVVSTVPLESAAAAETTPIVTAPATPPTSTTPTAPGTALGDGSRHRHGGNPSPSRARAPQQTPPVGDNLETGSGVAAPAPPIREIVLPPVREADDGDEESSGDESGREDEERRKGEQR